jgi:6-pyruvoyltetrahydropterin/6-carboxytetrahydropterin synthase
MYGLKAESSFDAAHFLTNYNGKCENLHGHRWRVIAYLGVSELESEGTNKGMVVDFAVLSAALRKLTDSFDHTFVVEEGSLASETVRCLKNEGFTLKIVPFRTTAENLAKQFFDALQNEGLPVCRVEVYETPNNCAVYYE